MSEKNIKLNSNITILNDSPITNSKASETYVSVLFNYDSYSWEGYVPIEYRRTGTSINFDETEKLYSYLNDIYLLMSPEKLVSWNEDQAEFWKTKPKASTTKKAFSINYLKVVGNVVLVICLEILTHNEEYKI